MKSWTYLFLTAKNTKYTVFPIFFQKNPGISRVSTFCPNACKCAKKSYLCVLFSTNLTIPESKHLFKDWSYAIV